MRLVSCGQKKKSLSSFSLKSRKLESHGTCLNVETSGKDYFDPVVIPTIEHIPWVEQNIPIPPGIHDEVIRILKEKIRVGVYKRSNSSYQSKWFCVLKKDGKSLCLVHDLQPLNTVTIKDSGTPPILEFYADNLGGRGCYTGLDLFVAFDHRALSVQSRDLTTFQTHLGLLRLTSLPMGATNSANPTGRCSSGPDGLFYEVPGSVGLFGSTLMTLKEFSSVSKKPVAPSLDGKWISAYLKWLQ